MTDKCSEIENDRNSNYVIPARLRADVEIIFRLIFLQQTIKLEKINKKDHIGGIQAFFQKKSKNSVI